jgi:hypothetical protein
MKNMLLFFACLVFGRCCCAQPLVYNNTFTNPFAAAARPASLPQIKHTTAGMLAERKFMLKELTVYTMSIIAPVAAGAFSLMLHTYGGRLYNEQAFGLSYGRTLGSKLSVGLGFDYQVINIHGYGKDNSVRVNAGLMYHLTEKFQAGFHIMYPSLKHQPLTYMAGAGYDASPQCNIAIEFRKMDDSPPEALCVLEYRPVKYFSCLLGAATSAQLNYAGFSLIRGKIRAGITGSYHPQLGLTPNIMIVWQRKDF